MPLTFPDQQAGSFPSNARSEANSKSRPSCAGINYFLMLAQKNSALDVHVAPGSSPKITIENDERNHS